MSEKADTATRGKTPRFTVLLCTRLKVTVQFETEGNGQNGIFNHMDRSEVKL